MWWLAGVEETDGIPMAWMRWINSGTGTLVADDTMAASFVSIRIPKIRETQTIAIAVTSRPPDITFAYNSRSRRHLYASHFCRNDLLAIWKTTEHCWRCELHVPKTKTCHVQCVLRSLAQHLLMG